MNKESCYLVPEEWTGQRLDRFLASQDSGHSRGYFQNLLTKQLVKVNERSVKASYQLKAGDTVFLEEPSLPLLPTAEAIPLEIIFEDDDLIVVNKPVQMSVHPTTMEETGTLVQALLYHSLQIAEAIYDMDSLVSRLRPGIVHRLDKDTTGLLVVAKNKPALISLTNQFKEHLVTKEYTALLFGNLSEPLTIHTNLKRNKRADKNVMGVHEKGREAITHINPLTHYFFLKEEQEVTLVSCQIETGRTHQIRVHCKHSGHPVLGDPLYTTKPARSFSQHVGAKRQLLHASKLSFTHPRTGEPVSFTAPLPEDMREILTKLEPAC